MNAGGPYDHDEQLLLIQLRNGNERAFTYFYERHSLIIYRKIKKMVKVDVGASTLDVSTTDSYEAGSKKTTATDKKTAYLGPFTQSYLRSFGVRFSAYQNAKQSASLNFYNTISLPFDKNPFKFDNRPDVLLGTGYTLAFLDKDKAKSFLNVELFLNFTDMLNSNKADTKFYQRHELGLRIGVPFNSIFINK